MPAAVHRQICARDNRQPPAAVAAVVAAAAVAAPSGGPGRTDVTGLRSAVCWRPALRAGSVPRRPTEPRADKNSAGVSSWPDRRSDVFGTLGRDVSFRRCYDNSYDTIRSDSRFRVYGIWLFWAPRRVFQGRRMPCLKPGHIAKQRRDGSVDTSR